MRRLTASLLLAGLLSVPLFPDTYYGGERYYVTIGAYTGFIIEPPDSAKIPSNPWAWYAPNIGGYPAACNEWLMSRLVQRGFWIAGINVNESYGAPYGRLVFSQFYDTLMARYALNPRAVLVPQSRGGLMLYNWAAEPGNPAKVARIAGIYPVGDLRSYPGLSSACGAYGMTVQQLTDSLAFHNPIDRLQPLYDEGIMIFHIHGDNDAVVPLSANSQIIHDRYTALGGDMTLVVVPGAGHAEIDAFFKSQELLDFILADPTVKADGRSPGRKAAMAVTRLVSSPEPFRSTVRFSVQGGNGTAGPLKVYNLAGKEVVRLEPAHDGYVWTTGGLPAGIYLARSIQGARTFQARVTLMK